MKFLSFLLAVVLFIPSANAAVISTTKQKKLPVISNVLVNEGLKGFSFDVVKAPTLDGYDVWGRLVSESTSDRITGRKARATAEWLIKSMKLRTKKGLLKKADFKNNIGDFLKFAPDGPYEFTVFVCPSNLNKPTELACATAKKTITVGTAKKAVN